MIMNIPQIALIYLPLAFLSGCGGGSSGGDNSTGILGDAPPLGQACDNNFHREIIGDYTGTVTYPSLNPDDAALIGSCTWNLEMSISVGSSELGCFLDAEIEAPVTQDIVFANDDPSVYQCFDDNSIRSVFDNLSFSLSQEQLDAIPFPHTLTIAPQAGVPSRGPYFDNVDISARHIHLVDAQLAPLNALLFNGDGTATVQSAETTTGFLTKVIP